MVDLVKLGQFWGSQGQYIVTQFIYLSENIIIELILVKNAGVERKMGILTLVVP